MDTRELVRIIRERGVMNAIISDTPEIGEEALRELRAYKIEQAVRQVTCSGQQMQRAGQGVRRVALWDFGAKRNIARELLQRGCDVTSVPADATAEEILALKPDGVMLSNGPGDPADNMGVIRELSRLCEAGVPIFGICLGISCSRSRRAGRP